MVPINYFTQYLSALFNGIYCSVEKHLLLYLAALQLSKKPYKNSLYSHIYIYYLMCTYMHAYNNFLRLQAEFGNCRNFEKLGNTHFISRNFCFIFLLSCFNSFCFLKNVSLSCLGSIVPKLLLLSVTTVVHCYSV